MPQGNDDRFENFLRGFEPRHPRPLPAMEDAPRRRLRMPLAIAALMLIALGLATWDALVPAILAPARPIGSGVYDPAMTIGGLNELLRRDPGRFDSAIAEASPRLLPDVSNPHGLLHSLAGE